MQPLSYYKTTSVSIPRKDDYMTIYYYRKGIMIAVKKQFDENFEPPKNCVEEVVFDEISYNAHLKHYYSEVDKLHNEFKDDLIEKYEMKNHPKAEICFDKAWDFGGSMELWDVEDYFASIVEIFKKDKLGA
jgi:hypothetical protein